MTNVNKAKQTQINEIILNIRTTYNNVPQHKTE